MELKKALIEQTQTTTVRFGNESLKVVYRPYAISYDDRLRYDRRQAELVDRLADLDVDMTAAKERRTEARKAGDGEAETVAGDELKSIQARVDAAVEETFELYSDALCETLVEWDLRDDGALLPIDASTFRRLPQEALGQIMEAIREDQGERNAGRSRNGSARKAR